MFKRPSPSLVISMLALLISLGGAGYSATGGVFRLGESNSASATTRLVTPLAGAAFRVDNTSTAADATGMTIITNAARPPLRITSATKVAYLNADKLDGIDSTGFLRIRADVTGALSFSAVAANSCATFSAFVSGALVGDAAFVTQEGNVPLPAGLMLFALKVTGPNDLSIRVCNVTSSTSSAVTGLSVRIITLR